MTTHPSICLNMIVRNEAHIVHEVLDTVAPYISYWVIVDTGSDDGTQDVIRKHMESLGIPGELHERPWRDFGHNRSEALDLAHGHADYIWVIDADDLLVGTPDFSGLTADCYHIYYGLDVTYWRRQIFRDGLPWRYEGVLHEYATCDEPFSEERLEGDYHVQSRRLGGRSMDPQKYARDAELLLAEVERNPDDPRSVFYLARSYFDARDFANARKWYARRAEMGYWEEEVYYSLMQLADSMLNLDEPWPEVQDAYLRAWEYRPARAEPLYAIANRYRREQRYCLGYLFAERAAQIPHPPDDILFVNAEVYAWRAVDEQAVCASWIDKHAEAFALCRRLLARTDIPEEDRQRIAANRDISVPTVIDAASAFPEEIVRNLADDLCDSDLTVSLIAVPDRTVTERTLNSFLNSCLDVSRVGRVLVLDAGLWPEDRASLQERYPFLEFGRCAPGAEPAQIRHEIQSRFWLHLGQGWRFFAPERLVGRLTAILEAEPEVFQVGINFGDAAKLTGACAPESGARRTDEAGRYVLTDAAAKGPAMFDTARLDRAGEAGLRTATLDEVLCIAEV